MVIVICGEGYTKSQQGKFVKDVIRLWNQVTSVEPYRSLADDFNVYALCTTSESTFGSGGSTFFDVTNGSYGRDLLVSNVNSMLKNHILDRCIGPEFIDKIHDAHIENKTDPNTLPLNPDGTRADEYALYRYVFDYISEFVLLVNTPTYGGASISNMNYGLRYATVTSDNSNSPMILLHELGHGIQYLTEEYSTGTLSPDYDIEANACWTGDPEKVKWKNLLGFRTTYSTRNEYNQSNENAMVGPSWECIMRSVYLNKFCEICKLHSVKVETKDIKVQPTFMWRFPR